MSFTGYSRQKNPVQTGKKSSSSDLIFQTGELQKSSADRKKDCISKQDRNAKTISNDLAICVLFELIELYSFKKVTYT